MEKRYVLTIVWNPETGEIEHLSEEFSDLEVISFEINGHKLDLDDDLIEELESMNTEILGIS